VTTTITARWRDLTATTHRWRPVARRWWRRTTWPWRLRIALRDRDLIAALRQLRNIDPTHGDCPVCGRHLALNSDGRLRRHGDCAGGGELPAREGVPA